MLIARGRVQQVAVLDGDELGAIEGELDVGADEGRERSGRIGRHGHHRGAVAEQLITYRDENFAEQGFLPAEVVIESRTGELELGADVVHGHAVKAPDREQARCNCHELFAPSPGFGGEGAHRHHRATVEGRLAGLRRCGRWYRAVG